MTYEFTGSFTDEERQRITGALDEIGSREDAVRRPSWSISRREVGGSYHLFAVAMDRRAVKGGRSSFYGRNLNGLIGAIRAGNAE